MILQYTSSNGQTFDLKVGHLRTRTANFHDYSWTPKTIDQQYGQRVYRFDKGAVTYTALMSVFGSLDERRNWLNVLHAAFDADISSMTPGKITHGMYSIDCYIILSSTFYKDPFTQNQINIYCPYPFWTKATTFHLTDNDNENTYSYLDFDYDFLFDYMATLPGYSTIENEAVRACDWKMTIYGSASNPVISIDGNPVGVYATIGADEKVVISSKNKTVVKVSSAGETNLFNQRIKGTQMFERLAGGTHSVLWSGAFDADIVLYAERSEPPWI